MDRFRVTFAALLFVAVATSVLAGWGVIGSVASPFSSGSAAVSTASPWGSISSSTTVQSSTESTATVSNTVTSTVTTGSESTTTLTTSAAAATNSTSSQYGFVSGSANGATTSSAAQDASALASVASFGAAGTPGESLLRQVQATSLLLAPVSWVLLGGAWVWRGRVRARYSEMGFGSDVFELFMKMKGGATRIKVLNTLTTPKDRLQLAQEMGVDWKTVDRHVQILSKYGFVSEQAAYGVVRLYEVTPMGKMLLNLFDDLAKTDGQVAQQQTVTSPRSQGEPRSGT